MNRATSATGWVRNPDGSLGYTLNQMTGCLNHVNGLCKGGGFPCYAYKLAHGRLRKRYLANPNYVGQDAGYSLDDVNNLAGIVDPCDDPFYPRFWPERLIDVPFTKKPLGIFVCDMSELFGDWIPPFWQEKVFKTINMHPEHRFYLLTRQPQNLIKFSPFPDNCWVGVTATDSDLFACAVNCLMNIKAKVKYVSIEPLLGWPGLNISTWLKQINWLIIGACTGTKTKMETLIKRYPELTLMPYGKIWTAQPEIEWVEEIVRAADRAGIPVFLKDNLMPLLNERPPPTFHTGRRARGWELIQEMPA